MKVEYQFLFILLPDFSITFEHLELNIAQHWSFPGSYFSPPPLKPNLRKIKIHHRTGLQGKMFPPYKATHVEGAGV